MQTSFPICFSLAIYLYLAAQGCNFNSLQMRMKTQVQVGIYQEQSLQLFQPLISVAS